MTEPDTDALAITETFLKEMLEADDTANFALYTKRYEPQYLAGFTRERFDSDIEGMHARNGMNAGYAYLGALRSGNLDGLEIHRTVWQGIYDKRDAVIEMAVYQRDGQWYVIKSAVY